MHHLHPSLTQLWHILQCSIGHSDWWANIQVELVPYSTSIAPCSTSLTNPDFTRACQNLTQVLTQCNIKTTCPSEKLDYSKIGPFKVLKWVGSNAYQPTPVSLRCLHPVFNINLLESYTSPLETSGHIQGDSSLPDMQLEGEDGLHIKDFLDIWKVGQRFDYLVEFVGKPISEQLWIPLLKIPTSYDEFLEQFHHHHTSLPRPSTCAFKARSHVTEHLTLQSQPTLPAFQPPIQSIHDPLTPPQHPPSPPPSWSWLFHISTPLHYYHLLQAKSRPWNLHHITNLITSNQPQGSLAA